MNGDLHAPDPDRDLRGPPEGNDNAVGLGRCDGCGQQVPVPYLTTVDGEDVGPCCRSPGVTDA